MPKDEIPVDNVRAKNIRLAKKLIIVAVIMFGFAYALVPIYTLVCSQTGINGQSSNTASSMAGIKEDFSRTIDVTFASTIHGHLGFQFRPLIRHVKVHPGQLKLIYYYAQNKTGHGMTVQAIPSIMPDEGARYFKKTQCFCFTQQYFFKGEKADMPVYFYINPKIDKDIKAMTLSYTLFDVTHFLSLIHI